MAFLSRLTSAFPLWVFAASAVAFFEPEMFIWFRGPLIPVGLGIIMLGMGLTLDASDFRRVLERPHLVLLGFVLQYTVMPFVGWLSAWIYGLSTPLAVGLILVAACPGGTASNVITYLARGDVPLSVTMTACSTLAAAVMTPFLTALLASSRVDVPTLGLFVDTGTVVIVPVVAGVVLRTYFPRVTRRLLPAAPLLAVVFITLIVASVIGQAADTIRASAQSLLLAVLTLHAGGFALGYILARILGTGEIQARTISIEVGMQNSGLGATLARQNFPLDPLYPVPSAVSALVHSLIGSALAAVWSRKPPRAAAVGSPIVEAPPQLPVVEMTRGPHQDVS